MRHTILRALILSATVLTVAACEDEKKPAPPAPAPSGSAAAVATETAKPAPAPKKPMAEMQIATIDSLIAAMNAHDAKKYAASYATNAVLKVSGMPDIASSEAIGTDIQKVFTAFSDFKAVKGRVWQKGNVAVAEWMVSGTQSGDWMGVKASNRPVGVIGISVDTFDDDGLLKEEHRYFDAASLMSQLDAKAAAGSFRPVEKTAPPTDVHMSKGTPDEAKNLDVANNIYKLIDDHKTTEVFALGADDITFVDYTQPGEMKGKKAGVDYFTMMFKAFPDLKQTKGTQIAADDFVVTEGALSGTQKGPLGPLKASNKPVNLHFVDVIQFKDGKMVHGWTYGNAAEMLVQIGAIPAPGTAPAASGSGAAPAGNPPAGGTAKPGSPSAPAPKAQ